MAKIARTAVDSTAVKALGYDPENQTMAVEYHNGGVHHMIGVPTEVYEQIRMSKSVGKALHEHCPRGRYASEKQAEEQATVDDDDLPF